MISKNQSLYNYYEQMGYMYPVLPFVKGFDPFWLYKIMLFILSGFTMSHILFEWGREFQRTLFRKSFLTALKIRWLQDSRTKMFFRPASLYSIILDFLFLSFHLWNLPRQLIITIYSDAARGWAGWALAHPEFGSSVNPITIRGADYAYHITASPPGFEIPAASL